MSSRPAWVLIVGCGYVGIPFAKQQVASGHKVLAITRSSGRAAELKALGIVPIVGSWLEQATYKKVLQWLGEENLLDDEAALETKGRVLIAVPHRPLETNVQATENSPGVSQNTPNATPKADLQTAPLQQTDAHTRGLAAIEASLAEHVAKVVYLSTTGVYGQQTGQVNESTEPSPTRIGPQIAVAAEQHLASSRLPATVLRLAGIYGPGRIPLAAKLKAGEPLAVPQGGFLNLIHRDDIVRAIEAVFANVAAADLYVLSDNSPVKRMDFYGRLAELCGIAEPNFIDPDEYSTRARRAGDKQVDSSKFWSEHQLTPTMVDYRAGLAASLDR